MSLTSEQQEPTGRVPGSGASAVGGPVATFTPNHNVQEDKLSYSAMRRKRFTAGVLAGAMAFTVMPILGFTGTAGAAIEPTGDGHVCEDAPDTDPFTDVTDADPAVDEIRCMVNTEPEITKGTGDGTTYEPNASPTRRQIALFFFRVGQVSEANEVGNEITAIPAGDGTVEFSDIAADDEAFAEIDALSDAGIVNGFDDGTFRPNLPVTRRQMANLDVRLQEALAGEDITPDNSPDAFTDDDDENAETQASFNTLAEEGVFEGDGNGMVNPGDDLTRRQMAFINTRTLEWFFQNNVIQRLFSDAGAVSGTVTSAANSDPITFDTDDGTTVSFSPAADTDTGDTFFIDGASATEAAFKAAATPGDAIEVTDTDGDGTATVPDFDVHRLTNNPVPTSGLVGAVDTNGDSFSIITSAGTVLSTDTFGDPEDTYSVDGATVSQAAFEAALSLGDTIQTADTSTPATGEADTYALTNGSWDGTVGNKVDGDPLTFTADGVGDDPDNNQNATFSASSVEATGPPPTQAYTVDGATATFAQFRAALTNSDTIVYSRAGGVETFALTNVAISTSFSGTTDENTDTGAADLIGYISGTTQTTFGYGAVTNFRVNGVVATKTEFETAVNGAAHPSLPWGEAVSFDQATGVLSITTATAFGPNPIANVVATDSNGVTLSDDILDIVTAGGLTYVTALPADTAFGTTTPRWFVNGAEVSAATYEDFLVDIDADPTAAGDSFEIRILGIATEHRLTTNNTLP